MTLLNQLTLVRHLSYHPGEEEKLHLGGRHGIGFTFTALSKNKENMVFLYLADDLRPRPPKELRGVPQARVACRNFLDRPWNCRC